MRNPCDTLKGRIQVHAAAYRHTLDQKIASPFQHVKGRGYFHDYFVGAVITSLPPIYGRNTSGITTEPSACW